MRVYFPLYATLFLFLAYLSLITSQCSLQPQSCPVNTTLDTSATPCVCKCTLQESQCAAKLQTFSKTDCVCQPCICQNQGYVSSITNNTCRCVCFNECASGYLPGPSCGCIPCGNLCLNGGTPTSNGISTCSCRCRGSWTGIACELCTISGDCNQCPPRTCDPNSVFNEETCKCEICQVNGCESSRGTSTTIDGKCACRCSQQSKWDDSRQACVAIDLNQFCSAKLNCQHGSEPLNYDCMACKCIDGWSGTLCNECPPECGVVGLRTLGCPCKCLFHTLSILLHPVNKSIIELFSIDPIAASHDVETIQYLLDQLRLSTAHLDLIQFNINSIQIITLPSTKQALRMNIAWVNKCIATVGDYNAFILQYKQFRESLQSTKIASMGVLGVEVEEQLSDICSLYHVSGDLCVISINTGSFFASITTTFYLLFVSLAIVFCFHF